MKQLLRCERHISIHVLREDDGREALKATYQDRISIHVLREDDQGFPGFYLWSRCISIHVHREDDSKCDDKMILFSSPFDK